jgi:hypothetical protein
VAGHRRCISEPRPGQTLQVPGDLDAGIGRRGYQRPAAIQDHVAAIVQGEQPA